MLDALKKSSSIKGQILKSIKSSPKTVHNLWKQRNCLSLIFASVFYIKSFTTWQEKKNRPNLSNNCLLDEPELSELPYTTCHLLKNICCCFQQMWNNGIAEVWIQAKFNLRADRCAVVTNNLNNLQNNNDGTVLLESGGSRGIDNHS